MAYLLVVGLAGANRSTLVRSPDRAPTTREVIERHRNEQGPRHVPATGGDILGGAPSRAAGETRSTMQDHDWLTARFEESRPRLHALAYRMLGSHAEADDAVQETWLRLRRNDPAAIENAGGLLTTVVGRVCLDRLRARRARPEDPVDDLPTGSGVAPAVEPAADPADEALLAESVGAALMVVLDRLGPAERVAFVLHDVFGIPFDDVAEILGRTPDASRQLASRARRRLHGSAPDGRLDVMRQRDVVDAFLRAARGGDFDALMQLLDPDVALVPDAAAIAMGSLRETRGAAEVASALSGGARAATPALVDGVPAWLWAPGGQIRGVVRFTVRDDRIVAIDVTGDVERIAELEIVTLG
jgi:RNA polymerase sigma factor (sigma-70 family)